ncbi:hypothetical protein [Metapseudomonas otitidis]|uniref:hypothetical protein n=1 Tax=Metapseudomonas otitidis TaxID=319939 RepID=UPI002448A530|nr:MULTISPECIES: hypothetical protein [Pseudomonas]MDG9780605.1 hypothetical protein [Pseudomonas otitidis]MDL5597094.1 hypothetical protein [Bacillus subtilis]
MRDFIKARSLDIAIGVIFVAVFVALIGFRGDVLFVGLWYYLAVIGGTFFAALLVNPRPRFAGGAVLTAGLSLLFYVRANWHPVHTSDLLALGHLFSLPGAAVGVLVLGIVSRLCAWRPESWLFCGGLLGFLLGFAVGQVYICSTALSCDVLLN